VCWQHFHIVKQHFGFVMLYKAKNDERDPRDLALDRWFLLASLFVPLALFVIHTQPRMGALRPAAPVGMVAYGALAATWIARQFEKRRASLPMNTPKLALLAAVVPLQWCALLHAAHYGPPGILRAGIALGLFHSFQYHRLMWFHNRNRYSGPHAAARHGIAAPLAAHVARYFALAVGLNILLSFLPSLLFPSDVVQAAVWGIPFTHYCLDARIWKVRSDRELAAGPATRLTRRRAKRQATRTPRAAHVRRAAGARRAIATSRAARARRARTRRTRAASARGPCTGPRAEPPR
jgi:hypothetical protein